MKKIITAITAITLMAGLSACSKAQSTSTEAKVEKTIAKKVETKITHVNAAQAADLIKSQEGLVVLDVRTPGEFRSGHIDGAVNIDFKNRSFASEIAKLDKSKDYLIHCRSGGRSTASLKQFKSAGFNHIIHMDGGMIAWNKADLPTIN